MLSVELYTGPLALPRHPQVAQWTQSLSVSDRAQIDDALAYLEEHGRDAALPDVRHRMQDSRHFPHMSEVRVRIDDEHVYRVLVGFGPNDVPALLLAGNKAKLGNAWYSSNIPEADIRFDQYLRALDRAAKAKPSEEPGHD